MEQLKIDMEKAETIHSEETEARLKKDISTRRKEVEARLKKEGHRCEENPTRNSQGAPTPSDIDVNNDASEKPEVSDIRL